MVVRLGVGGSRGYANHKGITIKIFFIFFAFRACNLLRFKAYYLRYEELPYLLQTGRPPRA